MQQKNSSFALALKILKTLIRWGVWTAIGLYLLIIILLHLSSVQHFVGAQVAGALEKKLGTKVKIERVDLGFLNHFIVDGLVINDQSGKQMAKASRIAAKIDILFAYQWGEGAHLVGTDFWTECPTLPNSPTEKPNFQFLIDSLKSRNTTRHTPLDLNLQSLIIRHSNVRYDLLSAPNTPNKLNLNHLNVTEISGHIDIDTLTDSRICTQIHSLSFNEKQGLNVQNLRF